MPGSPKKRAARAAAERAKNMQEAVKVEPVKPIGETAAPASPITDVSAPLKGEVLPPTPSGADPTRTALKRAMRARAQQYAEAAIAVLAANMEDKNLAPDKRAAAANDLLAWGFGKPATEIEAGDGAQMIVIRRFGEEL